MLMIPGWAIGAIEVLLYFLASYKLKKLNVNLKNMDCITYYWMTMTILTMFWEIIFVSNYSSIILYAKQLIDTNTHVWTNKYDITYILPWKVSFIFYAEYGAYADREYMLARNDWSRIIESSHAFICGFFALLTITSRIFFLAKETYNRDIYRYYTCLGASMGSQLMNSILYMANYFNELSDQNNINYCTYTFPCTFGLLSRAFMYVNIFWTLMPIYALSTTMINGKNYKCYILKRKRHILNLPKTIETHKKKLLDS